MIKEILGDLIRDGEGILCHQVNYQGVMGGGIAYSIREKLLTPEQYQEYRDLCNAQADKLLGTVTYADCGEVTVANLFCQNGFTSSASFQLTNYEAMRQCFEAVRAEAERRNAPVCLPGYIGCGIAGGNWEIVKTLIYEVFDAATVPVTIIYWEAERNG